MAYYDGRALTATNEAAAQICASCDNRGITLRKGVLLCSTHAWEAAYSQVVAVFAGEPVFA